LNWTVCKFDQLTAAECYALLALRSAVFVVEQNCVFLDADGYDLHCQHLLGWSENNTTLVATARLVPPGVKYPEASIGRVVVAQSVRGTGVGRELVQRAIDSVRQLYPNHNLRIGAQLYLKHFYESFGFITTGPIYDEDGIDHIEMRMLLVR
jgi:ElaA protein